MLFLNLYSYAVYFSTIFDVPTVIWLHTFINTYPLLSKYAFRLWYKRFSCHFYAMLLIPKESKRKLAAKRIYMLLKVPSSIYERRIWHATASSSCHLQIWHSRGQLFGIFDFFHPFSHISCSQKKSLKWLHSASHYFMSEMKKMRKKWGLLAGAKKMTRKKFGNDVDEYFTSKKGNILLHFRSFHLS